MMWQVSNRESLTCHGSAAMAIAIRVSHLLPSPPLLDDPRGMGAVDRGEEVSRGSRDDKLLLNSNV